MIPDWAGYTSFREAFREVMDERYHTMAWLDGEVLNGRVKFWRTDKAAIIAEVRDYPTGLRELHGLLAAGDLEQIVEDLIPKAEDWARANGCATATISSREGWARALNKYGYSVFQVSIRKDL